MSEAGGASARGSALTALPMRQPRLHAGAGHRWGRGAAGLDPDGHPGPSRGGRRRRNHGEATRGCHGEAT